MTAVLHQIVKDIAPHVNKRRNGKLTLHQSSQIKVNQAPDKNIARPGMGTGIPPADQAKSPSGPAEAAKPVNQAKSRKIKAETKCFTDLTMNLINLINPNNSVRISGVSPYPLHNTSLSTRRKL